MQRSLFAIVPLAVLAGCITQQPADYATSLSEQDPKWNTPECQQVRLAALDYDDKVGQRMAIGLATGLLLGPFGIPLAAAADASQNEKRRLFAREVHMRCSSLPLPENLKSMPAAAPTKNASSAPNGF